MRYKCSSFYEEGANLVSGWHLQVARPVKEYSNAALRIRDVFKYFPEVRYQYQSNVAFPDGVTEILIECSLVLEEQSPSFTKSSFDTCGFV